MLCQHLLEISRRVQYQIIQRTQANIAPTCYSQERFSIADIPIDWGRGDLWPDDRHLRRPHANGPPPGQFADLDLALPDRIETVSSASRGRQSSPRAMASKSPT